MALRSPRSASSSTGSVCLSTGVDSPVSAASSVRSRLASSRRRSAGTRSPLSSITMSPGTRSSAEMVWRLPSRSTLACGESMLRMLSRACSALPSWKKPIKAMMITTATMARASRVWPRKRLATAATSRMIISTLLNCSSNRRHQGRPFSCFSRFGPCCSRREEASSSLNPSRLLSTLAIASSRDMACQAVRGASWRSGISFSPIANGINSLYHSSMLRCSDAGQALFANP